MAHFFIRNPYNGKLVKRLRVHTLRNGQAMVKRALQAYEKLRCMPRYQRSEALRFIADQIRSKKNQFAKTIVQEAGKPISLAHAEVDRCVFTFLYASEECNRFGVEALPIDLAPDSAHRSGRIERMPMGPVLGITPFNFPLNLVAHKVAPALAVGSSVLIKPSEQTPLSALLLKSIVDETDLPKDSMQVVLLPGKQTESLVKDRRIPMVSFTGSAAVGWHIKQVAYRKKVTLELGGNAFAVFTQDGDEKLYVDRVVAGAFRYAGQSCISVQTALIQKDDYDVLRDKIIQKTKKLKYGNPVHPETMCGPLINEAAVDRLMKWILEARKQGAELLCGGERKGLVLAPTVLEKVPPQVSLSCEEAFGPVLILRSFNTDAEAVKMVNSSRFGLQTGVFTSQYSHIRYYFEHLEVGGVMINEVPTYRVDHMPYGGVKDSGFGREGLRSAMEEMTEPRLLVVKDLCAGL